MIIIFTKENNICDFLIAFLVNAVLIKIGLTLKRKEFAPTGAKFVSLTVDP